MRIINLQGENFKRMTAFDITPKGNTVVIAGKNGQGKTSVLDSIVMALAGKSSEVAKLTTKPIKEGASTAHVTVTTDEYVITRKWTEKDSYLEMKNREGMTYKSPQALLDQMIGDLCFDPLEFSRMKEKEQREALLGIVKLDIDLAQFDRDYKLKYDQRTSIGAQGKALQGKADTTAEVPVDTPDEEVSVADLVAKVNAANEKNAKILHYQRNLEVNAGRVATLEEQIADLQEQIKGIRNTMALEEKAIADFGPAEDTTALQQQIANAEATNNNVRLKKQKMAAAEDAKKYEAEYAKLSDELKQMQEHKAKKLEAAQFPIAGLSFTDDGVTYKGIPLPQCSAAEQLKVSMAIAMAKNPKLRVIRITDGSLLDEDNMKVLQEMADKNDFQIWVEKVDSSGTVGIVISDGEVVADNSSTAV